jgi:hypothetical protein
MIQETLALYEAGLVVVVVEPLVEVLPVALVVPPLDAVVVPPVDAVAPALVDPPEAAVVPDGAVDPDVDVPILIGVMFLETKEI